MKPVAPFFDKPLNTRGWLIVLLPVALAWLAIFNLLEPFSIMATSMLGLKLGTRLGDAVQFFLYDTPKVLLLLLGIVFLLGVIQTFFSPERTRRLLAGKRLGAGNGLAAALGVVTPFCSCSAVPLFIGFLSAGVPLGVTFSFLIAAPMINEIALILLLGLFGWPVALLYLTLGLTVAIVAGLIIGFLKMEHQLEPWVQAIHAGTAPASVGSVQTWSGRFGEGAGHTRKIIGKVWCYVVLGIAVGAAIHGYVPQELMASIMGREAPWWSLPLAVLIGVPMYASAAGIIPVIEALITKGAALGTALAFMMSVIALSLPEMVILRKVLRPPLIATFIGVVACGILIVGYVLNVVQGWF
jgi:uncharacterized membrane protein YraQ (UPF0718 family)